MLTFKINTDILVACVIVVVAFVKIIVNKDIAIKIVVIGII